MDGRGPRIIRHTVPTDLRGLVAGMVGFDETAGPGGRVRIQPASSLLVLEVSFTSPLHIRELRAGGDAGKIHQAFLAGLMPGPVRTRFLHRHASVQVYLTPLGAHRLLGVPGRETAGQVMGLAELEPRWARDLPARLADAPGWGQRFVIMTGELRILAAVASPPDPLVGWAWEQLQRTGGQLRIAELAERSGWSPRYVSGRFREVTGMTPKEAARVIRFERVHRELGRGGLSELAVRHGFSDQAHLSREVRRLAGEPPRLLARARRPTPFTALGVEPGELWEPSRGTGERGRAEASWRNQPPPPKEVV